MYRISTMSRFAEPDEPKVLGHCGYCSEPLEEGHTVIDFEGDLLCDNDCLYKAYGIKEKTL